MGAVNNIHTHLDLNSNEIRDFRLEHLESDPAAASGRLYYNSETREVRYSDGEKWISLNVGIWSIDEDGNIVASGDVIIDGNLIVKGDTASGGTGDPSTNVGIDEKELQDYLDEHKYVTEDDLSNEYLPLEGTAKKATQLEKSVTLWGQSFNGTKNISGELSGVSSLTGSTISGNKILFSANSNDAYTLSLEPDYLGPSEPSDEFYFGSEERRWLVLFAKQGNFSEDVEVSGSIGAQEATLLNGLTISSGGASIKGDVTIDGNLIVKGDTSSGGTGQDTPSGGVTEEDVEQYLTNYVNDITTTGSGNVISSVSKSGKIITFTKDVTALTSHQSIYALTIKNSEGATQTTYTPNSAGKSLTLTKAMVGLGNVENTALSSWAGTNNITTLGTITSGTWKGSKIANAYLANSSIKIAGSSVSLGGSIAASTITTAQIGSGNSFYHSGNANLTSVAWNCSSLTMGGALSGATTGSFSSTLTAQKIIISSTGSEEQLKFSRGGGNSIAAPTNGYFRFLSNGKLFSGGDTNADLIIQDSLVRVNGNVEIRNGISVFGGTNGDYSEGLRLHAATDGWNALMFCGSDNTGGTGTSAKSWGIFTDPNSNFIINKNASNNAATYAFCNVGGNWGIGTLVPSYKLHVDGETSSNIYYGGAQTAYSKNTSGMFRWGTFDESGGLKLQFGASSGAKFEIINSGWSKALFTVNTEADCTIGRNLIVPGDASSGSDIRFKDVMENKTIRIDDIANAPLFSFKWNDREDDALHLGTSAQYWEERVPELVSGSDFKTLNYAALGVAMGVSLAKKSVNHEERIKMLEDEIKVLNQELRRIKDGICNKL